MDTATTFRASAKGQTANPGQAYPAGIFNNQRLLFDITKPIQEKADHPTTTIPAHFYDHGWAVLDNVANEFAAIKRQEDFLASLDSSRLPMQRRFQSRIQLAKADQIPVCDDVVASSFQILHFDMGQPFLESEDQLLVTHVGIYLPKSTPHQVTARTRLLELPGLLKHLSLSSIGIEKRITAYVRQHGDGWLHHNTYRLACFARFIDALSKRQMLQDQTDKTVGQWFQNEDKMDEQSAHKKEAAFYAQHGIDLNTLERQIALKPGQLLILDNARVVHGRIGKRKTKEVFNFMFGVEAVGAQDIIALRQHICGLVN